MARNMLIFGVDMSFSSHANDKTNNIYVMGKDLIQEINFTELGVKFVLSLHYNGDNSYLFANGYQELKFKKKMIKY